MDIAFLEWALQVQRLKIVDSDSLKRLEVGIRTGSGHMTAYLECHMISLQGRALPGGARLADFPRRKITTTSIPFTRRGWFNPNPNPSSFSQPR